MCQIDWSATGAMLQGIGNVLLGIAAMLTLFIQFGYRKKAAELETSLRVLLLSYKQFMASSEGILISNYAHEPEAVINGLVSKTSLNRDLIKKLLDQLQAEGKLH